MVGPSQTEQVTPVVLTLDSPHWQTTVNQQSLCRDMVPNTVGCLVLCVQGDWARFSLKVRP